VLLGDPSLCLTLAAALASTVTFLLDFFLGFFSSIIYGLSINSLHEFTLVKFGN